MYICAIGSCFSVCCHCFTGKDVSPATENEHSLLNRNWHAKLHSMSSKSLSSANTEVYFQLWNSIEMSLVPFGDLNMTMWHLKFKLRVNNVNTDCLWIWLWLWLVKVTKACHHHQQNRNWITSQFGNHQDVCCIQSVCGLDRFVVYRIATLFSIKV